MITDFNVNFTEKEISLIYQKVKDYPWDSVKDLDGWEHGTNKKYLKELIKFFGFKDYILDILIVGGGNIGQNLSQLIEQDEQEINLKILEFLCWLCTAKKIK